jgi:hypothetical protein
VDLKKFNSELIKRKIDSVQIQLSTGSSFEKKRNKAKNQKNLLIFWSYYYLTDSLSAKNQYLEFKNRLVKFAKQNHIIFRILLRKKMMLKKRLVGYSEKW